MGAGKKIAEGFHKGVFTTEIVNKDNKEALRSIDKP
jgi:hypothetical protein